MKNTSQNCQRWIIATTAAGVALLGSQAHGVLPYLGGALLDSMDGLGINSAAWVNNSTLPGWYAFRSNAGPVLPGRADDGWLPVSSDTYNYYRRSNGQNESGGLLNFGNDNSSPDRALGSYSVPYDFVFALILRNDTAETFQQFSLQYFGEQWEVNFSTSHPGMKLDFTYGIFESLSFPPVNVQPNTVVPHENNDPNQFTRFNQGYVDPTASTLDFAAIVFGGTNGPLDGNHPTNRQLISSTESVNWAPGEFLVLRWFDDYENGVNAKLAVDDIVFSAQVPEPSAAFLSLCGFLLFTSRQRIRFR